MNIAKRMSGVEKVTVSLPRRLVEYADLRAAALGISRSQVISHALSELEARERDDLAREGYRFYATESEEFAAASGNAVSEALVDAR